MSEVAIRVDDVSKLYKLYDKPSGPTWRNRLGLTRKKLYQEHYALHNVSFDVKRGETVGIIGTNGSGKSTILKIITGVLNPSGGHVEIDEVISHCWSWAQASIWNIPELRISTLMEP